MNLTDLSIRRPVLMTMTIMSFVVLGLFSLLRLGVDLFPKVDFPFVIISIVYPGAGPKEMETQIAEHVEEVVSSIGGVQHVTSSSQEGLSLIIIEFDLEVNVDIAAIDVKDKVDQIRQDLPEDMWEPIIQKFDMSALPIINLAVSSPRSLDETYKIADKIVKDGLSRVRGLAQIDLTGGLEREIQVNLSRRKLRAYNLSPQLVTAMIAVENLNIPAGKITVGEKEITVRMAGEFRSLEDLKAVEIPFGDGNKVKLEELGWIDDAFVEQRERARFNGETSVGMDLIKRSDANTVEVARDVFKEIERIRRVLPSDVKIDVARNSSQFIQDSVDDVFGNMIIGVLLTVFVLYMFLHTIPITVVAAVSMPVSIVSSFILLDIAGFTLNMMSLMALAISVGILVANSIVILENIERFKKKGIEAKEAASRGTREIALAVAASTLTNIVVFTPMAFMSGIVGKFFKEFGLTVAFATLISLLVSFTLTPMMASRKINRGLYAFLLILTILLIYWRLGLDFTVVFILILALAALAHSYGILGRFFRAWDRFYDNLKEDYRRSLAWTLRHRILTLTGVTALFVASLSVLGFGFIGSEFFPKSDQATFSIYLEMPIGTLLDKTDDVIGTIADRVMQKPYVKSVYASSGRSDAGQFGTGSSTHLGMVVVQMVDKELRPVSTAEFIESLTAEMTDIPDAKIFLKEVAAMGGGGGEADLQVEITGLDIDYMNSIADSMMVYMQSDGGLVNIESSWKLGKPELELIPRRTQLADKGLSPAAVGMVLRNLIEGNIASRYREGGEEFDIRVKLDEQEVKSADDVDYLSISAEDDQPYITELMTSKYTEGPTSINRKDKRRMIMVTADVSTGTLGEKVKNLKEKTEKINLREGYGINFGGEAEMMADAFSEMFKALILAIILTYMLLAAILESYRHPFTIMLTLPLGLIGVVFMLFVTNNTISIFSLMAIVMLVGIVVNNGILLIDYINQLRRQGKQLDEAIIEACPVRLRPIIMANLATALGMLPLALGIGSGGEFRAPMAITSIGGLMSSAVFTLYVIPVIYRIFERDN